MVSVLFENVVFISFQMLSHYLTPLTRPLCIYYHLAVKPSNILRGGKLMESGKKSPLFFWPHEECDLQWLSDCHAHPVTTPDPHVPEMSM